ncbi:hypothetical protein [Actinomycetospora corticicola]|uniref:Uncharacterized protein n=1 Tax=Actinomycetospora corticicola TaxID=663602 RepID=A0A7Y9DVZ2_9PSEU|nr:hypothetical protein [Actinomycetospora corticicola]NYD36507.1 hypothetical protein [Actinomycetospora corticicola]
MGGPGGDVDGDGAPARRRKLLSVEEQAGAVGHAVDHHAGVVPDAAQPGVQDARNRAQVITNARGRGLL